MHDNGTADNDGWDSDISCYKGKGEKDGGSRDENV